MTDRALDIEIRAADNRPGTVVILSRAMQCEFAVKVEGLGKVVADLHAEWNDLIDAGII